MATSKSSSIPASSSLPLRAAGGSPILRGLLWLAALAIASAASVTATWWLMQRQHAETMAQVRLAVGQAEAGNSKSALNKAFSEPPAKPVPVPAPIFVALEPFTVSLASEDGERLLHVGITLRAQDEQTRLRLEKYMPEVRSRILMTLSAQSPAAIQSVQGKADVARAIADAVNQPFSPLPDPQHVSDALFTAFVVQ